MNSLSQTQPTTADVPRISREMGVIQKLIAEYAATAETLEQRLHAVLRPTGSETISSEQTDPRPASSPLTCDLEGFRLQLERTLSCYYDILNRLEV
jgi:hypothetical protein